MLFSFPGFDLFITVVILHIYLRHRRLSGSCPYYNVMLAMTHFTTGFQLIFVPRAGTGMCAPRFFSSDSSKNSVILASSIIAFRFLYVVNQTRVSGGPREGLRTFGSGLVMLVMHREFSSRGHHYKRNGQVSIALIYP